MRSQKSLCHPGADSGIGFNAAQRFVNKGRGGSGLRSPTESGGTGPNHRIGGHDRVRLEIADFSSMQSVSALADLSSIRRYTSCAITPVAPTPVVNLRLTG